MFRFVMLCLAVSILGFVIFYPAVARNREHGAWAARILSPHLVAVQPSPKGATLVVEPRRYRFFHLRVNGTWTENQSGNRAVDVATPVVVPVQAGTQFSYDFTDDGAAYRVQSVTSQGVTVEVLASESLWRQNRRVFLPFRVPMPKAFSSSKPRLNAT